MFAALDNVALSAAAKTSAALSLSSFPAPCSSRRSNAMKPSNRAMTTAASTSVAAVIDGATARAVSSNVVDVEGDAAPSDASELRFAGSKSVDVVSASFAPFPAASRNPSSATRHSSARGTCGSNARTIALASSSAPYSGSILSPRPFISIALAVSMVRLLSLNARIHPMVVCFVSFADAEEPFAAEPSPSPSVFFPGRYWFSRRIHASPFSDAEAMIASRVSKSVNLENTSKSGRTTLTRKPFWCLAKM